MSNTRRMLRGVLVCTTLTLTVVVTAALGKFLPEYFGGALGNIVAPTSLLLVFGLVVITPHEPLLKSASVFIWWTAISATMTLVLVSFITYTLPYLGNMAMEAFMSAVIDELGPVDVLKN